MYCEKCHRQSPDNFDSCAYCSAPFQKIEDKKPAKFVKAEKKRKRFSRKTVISFLIIIAFVLCVAAVTTGVLTGTKPETAVKTLCQAIESNNGELYYSLFDEQIKEYKKTNWYFNDDETYKAMVEALDKSVAFYTENCGEEFKVSYKIIETAYITEEELTAFNATLAETYGYKKLPTDVAIMDFEINVSGKEGSYKSVYKDFYFMKINRKWYKTDVITEQNTKTAE